MTLIDTAESYGSEELIGRAIAGQRDRVFLVSKLSANHVGGNGIARACDLSLRRLGTDYLDLYLLHWPNGITDYAGVVTAFETLRSAGKVRAWGVSNFSVSQLEKLFRVPQGDRCATNQVLYSAGDRGIERDLLPWCEQHGMPVMAYSPLGGYGANLLRDPTLARIAAAHGCSVAAFALDLDHPQRPRHCDSRVGLRGAHKGECSRAVTHTDIGRDSSAGCSSPTAQTVAAR